jgi:uncharacterized protein (DUF885 family)
MRTSLTGFLLLFLLHPLLAQTSPKPSEAFARLVDEYFDFVFKYQPTFGTESGFHQYDTELEDFAAGTVSAEIAGQKQFLARFEAFPKPGLPEDSAADLDFLAYRIRARLLDLEDIPMWRKDPDFYTSTATNGIFLLMRHPYAPPEERLQRLIAREKKIPGLLTEARNNLNNPPRVYTEVALEQLPDTIEFFRSDVPQAFASVKDEKLLREFKASNQAAIAALTQYQDFVKGSLLPKSNGDFRIGAENFRKKLLYEEMVDIPLDRLLEIGYADLRKNQQQLKEVAAQIDPKRPARDVINSLQDDHPAAGELLQKFRDTLGGLRKFLDDKKIITTPDAVLPVVEETPPFERALTTASMETPGAYEKHGDAIFNVTLPDPTWDAKKVEEWMRGFNYSMISGTAIHEVYPGHYEQYAWWKDAPSKVRKLLYSSTNAEGWAHYTEQMMLDEGYGNGDPKLRAGQLVDALLRDCRFIAGIEMHTGKMTLEQAIKFFQEEGFQTSAMAEEESKRGTSDPTYLVYTLGKLQILKLREDYRKVKGDQFSLLEFHNTFMVQGGMPVKIIRRKMLGNDSPTLE